MPRPAGRGTPVKPRMPGSRMSGRRIPPPTPLPSPSSSPSLLSRSLSSSVLLSPLLSSPMSGWLTGEIVLRGAGSDAGGGAGAGWSGMSSTIGSRRKPGSAAVTFRTVIFAVVPSAG